MIHVSEPGALPQSGDVYIFGAGQAGTILHSIFENIPGARVVGFIDNHKTGEVNGLKVQDFPSFLSGWDGKAAIVIATMYVVELAEQLKAGGVKTFYNAYPLIETTLLDRGAAEVTSHLSEAERLSYRLEYLFRHMQRQEVLLRACARALGLSEPRQQTLAAFEYQWAHEAVSRGPASHYDEQFRRRAPSNVCNFTGLDPSWFKGKSVLDGGCGDGRYSHALCALGADVMSVDMSESGVKRAKENCAAFPTHRGRVANLLSLELGETFDLVWSFGVTHHTGDTERAVGNLVRHVKPGGYFTLMVYGQPRWDKFGDIYFDVRKERLMSKVLNLPLAEAEAVVNAEFDEEERQGWFDAVTPSIEDHYTTDQMEAMLRAAGLVDVINMNVGHRHMFFRGRRPEA